MISTKDALRVSMRVGSNLMFKVGVLSFVFNEWGLTTMAWVAIIWSIVIGCWYILIFGNDR